MNTTRWRIGQAKNCRSSIMLATAAAALAVGLAQPAAAAPLLVVDRGLPTANLNNAAGANRSNVAWAEGSGSTTTSIGDSFSLASEYVVTDIRVWVLDSVLPAADAYQLWIGTTAGVTPTTLSSSVVQTHYADGEDYERTTPGSYRNIYQVDFAVSLDLTAGTYAFAVSGPGLSGSGNATPFLSASNATLSGSPQDGADGIYYGFNSIGQMDTTNGYPADSNGNGWDKSSDVNVQVFVPEPSSFAVLGLGVFGFAMLRGRQRT